MEHQKEFAGYLIVWENINRLDYKGFLSSHLFNCFLNVLFINQDILILVLDVCFVVVELFPLGLFI